jgi:hypothetical protein
MNKDLEALARIALKDASSMRRCQRVLALLIGSRNGNNVPKEELRDACRVFRVYDPATFSYYMADLRPIHKGKSRKLSIPWFRETTGKINGRKSISGWCLTKEGRAEAERLIGLAKLKVAAGG